MQAKQRRDGSPTRQHTLPPSGYESISACVWYRLAGVLAESIAVAIRHEQAHLGASLAAETVHPQESLYATSAQCEAKTLRPPRNKKQRKASRNESGVSALEVAHLPGKVDISSLRSDEPKASDGDQPSFIATLSVERTAWHWTDIGVRTPLR